MIIFVLPVVWKTLPTGASRQEKTKPIIWEAQNRNATAQRLTRHWVSRRFWMNRYTMRPGRPGSGSKCQGSKEARKCPGECRLRIIHGDPEIRGKVPPGVQWLDRCPRPQ